MRPLDLSVYLIASSRLTQGRPLADVVAAAVAGGVTCVQLREKSVPDRQVYITGLAIRSICRRHGVPLIVNDRVDLALALDADGVHLGQEDLSPELARRLLGPDRRIGVSVETEDEARSALAEGADHLGTGPVYATATKGDAGAPYGPEIVARIKAAVGAGISVVGVGGIDPGGAGPVLAAGADGLAVSSAILAASDPAAVASALVTITREYRGRA